MGIESTETKPKKSNSDSVDKLIKECTEFLEGFDPNGQLDDTQVTSAASEPVADTDSLIEELKSIYNPVLAIQGIDDNVGDRVKQACSENNVLTEANVIHFDNDSRRAQLESICSLLLAKKSNSSEYEAFKQASRAKKAIKLKIQRDNHAAAKALADAYLNSIATGSSSPDLRKAAHGLSSSTTTLD